MKKFLKSLIPPVFSPLYRKIMRLTRKSYSFSGVFSAASEVHDENPWKSKAWLDIVKQKISRKIQEQRANTFFSNDRIEIDAAIISLTLNLLTSNSSCNVFDFGGGAGEVLYAISPYLEFPKKITWNVVDSNQELFEIGSQFANTLQANIKFLNQMPELNHTKMDVLLISSSLQYIYDYHAVLDQLLKHNPRYVILTRLLAGDIKTFITCQNIHGKKTPCVFINIQEIFDIFLAHNYKIIFKSQNEDLSSQFAKNIPMDDFFAVNLIFEFPMPDLAEST